MKTLLAFLTAACCLLPVASSAGEAPDPKELEILQLKKANAELAMEVLKLRYDLTRLQWKALLKALGEPDPDEPKKEEKK